MHLAGAFLDDIVVKNGGTTLLTDDVETRRQRLDRRGRLQAAAPAPRSRSATGTTSPRTGRTSATTRRSQTGPYQFSNALTAPNWVEHFPFQDGLLVWAVDETYSDNNTIEHQGHGLALPVDARPAPFTYPDGTRPSNRRQPFDATFGLQTIDKTVLHKEIVVGKGKNQTVQQVEAVGSDGKRLQTPTFTDADEDAYFSPLNPLAGVYVAGHGVTVTVTGQTTGGTMTVDVANPAE